MPDIIETLTTAIAMQETALRASIPPDREAALVALVRAQDRLLDGLDVTQEPPFDLIHGSRLANPGGSLAICLALGDPQTPGCSATFDSPGARADEFLTACAGLVDATQVLTHLASGFMRGEVQPDGSLAVWIAQKRVPPPWRERIDLAWWDARSHRLGGADRQGMSDWQFGFLPDAIVAGIPARTWTDAVRLLVARLGHDAPLPVAETEILRTLIDALGLTPEIAIQILSAMTVGPPNAAWHAAVPGIAAAPFVRLGPETLMPSSVGLRTQPLLFLARELRRRDPQSWHNAAHQREAAFRHDIATVFADKRFVHALARIQLRREGGSLRTDIDAAIFDRKTGTLAVFELKAQDPFSRSAEELDRRRDNLLAANRQLAGILDWTKRHTPDEILDRIDHQTAKRFKVQRVLPFVLARTLARFIDGPPPDKRAAWGAWPDVLRLHDAGVLDPINGNPLQTLFTRLQTGTDPSIPPDTPPHLIRLGNLTITVSPSRPTPPS